MSGDTFAEQMNPSFRKMSFSDDAAIVTVSTLLREAWTAMPPEQVSASALGNWMRAHSKKTPEEQAITARNKDFSLYTAWRDFVYEMFNHVFYDVHRFLREAAMLEGDFKPPSHEAFALPFLSVPSSSNAVNTMFEKSWSVATYLIPAYIARGVTVRAYRLHDRYGTYGDQGKELDKFSLEDEEKQQIWYILAGTKVRFAIDVAIESQAERHGVAAVLVVGLFTSTVGIEEEVVGNDEQWMGLTAKEHQTQ